MVYVVAVVLALVASLETLLTSEATDKNNPDAVSDDKLGVDNTVDSNTKKDTGRGLLSIFLIAFFSGFAALLTPCVFPMIPLTVTNSVAKRGYPFPLTSHSSKSYGSKKTSPPSNKQSPATKSYSEQSTPISSSTSQANT